MRPYGYSSILYNIDCKNGTIYTSFKFQCVHCLAKEQAKKVSIVLNEANTILLHVNRDLVIKRLFFVCGFQI